MTIGFVPAWQLGWWNIYNFLLEVSPFLELWLKTDSYFCAVHDSPLSSCLRNTTRDRQARLSLAENNLMSYTLLRITISSAEINLISKLRLISAWQFGLIWADEKTKPWLRRFLCLKGHPITIVTPGDKAPEILRCVQVESCPPNLSSIDSSIVANEMSPPWYSTARLVINTETSH